MGLHPNVSVVPPVVRIGGVLSSVHVTVLDAVDVLLHASLAVHVLVCDRPHPVLTTDPSFCVKVVAPQASVAVAVPRAFVISPAVGLQPNVVVVPPVEIIGGVASVTVTGTLQLLVHVLPSVIVRLTV